MRHDGALRRSGSVGMVLGKFMPPHLGHLYLVEAARAHVDRLIVVVEHIAGEPIPSTLRHRWMTELVPGAEVVHLTDENPQDPSEHPDFWRIWRESLARVLPARPDYVFASERYGVRLAAELGAEFVPVDPGRMVMPISGTEVRRRPLDAFAFLPPCVRAHYVRRVCVFGPESVGKSTLCRRLAAHYDTVAVPEYARTLIEMQDGAVSFEDMARIARGQLATEEALARRANRVLFSDTDLLSTTLWSNALFGRVEPWLEEAARAQRFDLTLLLDVDVPWVADVVRYLPDERRSFFERCERALREAGRTFVHVRGDWDARWAIAVAAVDALLAA